MLCQQTQTAHPARSVRGVALFEFALTISLLLSLTAGLVDLWKFCREADLILTASRHGARAAAAMTQDLAESVDSEAACQYTSGTNSALETAVFLSHKFLVAGNLESGPCTLNGTSVRTCTGSNFTVSASFRTLCEDGFGQRVIDVSITSNQPRSCVLCFDSVLRAIELGARSTFAAEADCKSIVAVSC